MSLSIQALANRMLAFNGIAAYTSTPMPSGMLESIAAAMTAGISEASGEAPNLFTHPVQYRLKAPITGTITVTNGSANFTLGTLAEAYSGGRILIDGETTYRRCFTNVATHSFTGAYVGTSGTKNCTMWMDGITIGGQQMGDAYANDQKLVRVTNMEEIVSYPSNRRRFPYGDPIPPSRILVTPESGVPRFTWTESVYYATWASVPKFQFFYPMPSAAYDINTRETYTQAVSVTDINSGGTILFPSELDELCLVPIIFHHWRRSPFAKDNAAVGAIAADYPTALDRLRKYAAQLGVPGFITTQ